MIKTTDLKERHIMEQDSRSAALRSELEATRGTFHSLLAAVTKAEWGQKSPGCEWTVGEVFVHLTWALEYLPAEVRKARRGQGMFNLPKRLADPLSYWYIRWLARSATPASIGRRYDRAMDAAIYQIDSIAEEDWTNGADFYAEGFHSVEDLFHVPAQHLTEHTAGFRRS